MDLHPNYKHFSPACDPRIGHDSPQPIGVRTRVADVPSSWNVSWLPRCSPRVFKTHKMVQIDFLGSPKTDPLQFKKIQILFF
jgi:hypothetical protein